MSTSNSHVQALADRFAAFNQQLISFVEQCAAADLRKITQAEGWSVGVTALHVGAIHYPIVQWVQMMVEGTPTPALTMADIDQINLQHTQEHANCTQAEVLDLLRQEGDKAYVYLITLDDTDLNRQAYLKVLDATISAGQLFTAILIDQAEEHLVSMKATAQA